MEGHWWREGTDVLPRRRRKEGGLEQGRGGGAHWRAVGSDGAIDGGYGRETIRRPPLFFLAQVAFILSFFNIGCLISPRYQKSCQFMISQLFAQIVKNHP
jgi:hypothetical protein